MTRIDFNPSQSARPAGRSLHPGRNRRPSGQALAARNHLVKEHRELVRPLALHYARQCAEPWEDLLQVGLLGLIRAAELYRSQSGTPFDAFARPHIRGAILHYLRDQAPAVRLPRRAVELQGRLNRLQRQSSATPNRAAQAPLQEQLGLNPRQWNLLLVQRQLSRTVPLDEREAERLEAPEQALPERLCSIRDLLGRLDPRQREVVKRVVLEGTSYRRLAQDMQVSAMTVQRLLRRGLGELRQQLEQGAIRETPRRNREPSGLRGW
jgi:RNA polymerase sigma-B factor